MTEAQSDDAPVLPEGASREIAFEVNGQHCALTIAGPGDLAIPSIFLVGLPKAGSTLLNRLMTPVARAAGLTFLAVPNALFEIGVRAQDVPPEINQVFRPTGYAFGGFRGLPGILALPPYAVDRTVLLIRDPRDMLTSLYFSVAFSHRPPGQGAGGALAASFEEKRREANSTDIDAFVLGAVRVVADQYRTVERKLAEIPHKLYRYEDVIFDKLAWAKDMVAYFGLSVRPGALARAVAKNDVRPEVEDKAEHIRRVVPGDHMEKLKPGTIAELNARLAPILCKYGYA